jgi:pimeloyl-ACP methyl ester carboxylesterase
MKKLPLRIATAAFMLTTVVVGLGATPAHADRASDDGCERVSPTVRLQSGGPLYTVAGWLCGPRNGGEVEFLLHGFSYNHLYWFGLDNQWLDYVLTANNAGHTTFIIDQVGTGQSSRPADPQNFTFTQSALVVHLLVGQLRAGQIGQNHAAYSRVIGIGHSMGGRTMTIDAGVYHDLDALVAIDSAHDANPAGTAAATAASVVANTLPQFAGLPSGYLTVTPRTVFYDTEMADPVVIAADEQDKDTATLGMLSTLGDARSPAYSTPITVPVLVLSGQQDFLSCDESVPGLSCATPDALANRERPYFTSTSCFQADVAPGGHSINLHPGGQVLFSYIHWWLNALRANPRPAGTCR